MRPVVKTLAAIAVTLAAIAVLLGRIPGIPGLTVLNQQPNVTATTSATGTITATTHMLQPPTQPPPGVEEAPERLAAAIVATTDLRAYRFTDTNPDGTPVRFSPCRPIHYVIRTENAPDGGVDLVHAAIANLSELTGLVFVYDGETDEDPLVDRPAFQPKRYGQRWAPVLIAWATPEELPTIQADLVGEATTFQLVRGNGYAHYVTGQIVFDRTRMGELRRDYGNDLALAVVKHELGHLVGLAHIETGSELMYPRTRDQVTEFQTGDRAGLALAGDGTCAPDI